MQKSYHVPVLSLASSAVLSVAILGVFSACMSVISRNLENGMLGKGGVAADEKNLKADVGESLFIAMLGIFFSCSAAAFSLRSQSESSVTLSRDYADEEGGDTEPLLGGAEREELVGEASPD